MNTPITLFWLELRKLGLWTLMLWATVILWALGYRSIALNLSLADGQVDAFFFTVVLAAALGMASGIGFAYGTWREMQSGQLSMLLGAPLNPLVLLLVRYVYAFLSIALYGIGMLWVWRLGLLQAGVSTDFTPLLGMWAYGLAGVLAPFLAALFFVTALSATYHLRGLSWLAGLVGMFGLGELLSLSGQWRTRNSEILPSLSTQWLSNTSLDFVAVRLPQEPLWTGPLLTVLFLFLAYRLLREVEL